MNHRSTGNGDWCPRDPEHGRMWMLPSGQQFCPHSGHSGASVYAHDGITPGRKPDPRPAKEAKPKH